MPRTGRCRNGRPQLAEVFALLDDSANAVLFGAGQPCRGKCGRPMCGSADATCWFPGKIDRLAITPDTFRNRRITRPTARHSGGPARCAASLCVTAGARPRTCLRRSIRTQGQLPPRMDAKRRVLDDQRRRHGCGNCRHDDRLIGAGGRAPVCALTGEQAAHRLNLKHYELLIYIPDMWEEPPVPAKEKNMATVKVDKSNFKSDVLDFERSGGCRFLGRMVRPVQDDRTEP